MKTSPILILGLRNWRLLLVLLMLPAGCGRREDAAKTEQIEPPKKLVVGVSLAKIDDPWGARMRSNLETAANQYPNLRLALMDAQGDAARQEAQLDEFLKRRVGAVIIRPVDPQAIGNAVAKLFKAGIHVVVLDRAVIGDQYSCFVTADPMQVGAEAGLWLAERLAGKGKIIELKGPVGSRRDAAILSAFQAALRDPGYRIVFSEHVDPPKKDAAALMDEALKRVESFDAVFAYDVAAARAARQAAETTGRAAGALFLAIGEKPPEGLAFQSEKPLDAVFPYPTGGAEAVGAAVDLIEGRAVPKTISAQARGRVRASVLPKP